MELNICDTQPSCLGGANNEFIFSGRLDNLASSYCALQTLIDSCALPGHLSNDQAIAMIEPFDNEANRASFNMPRLSFRVLDSLLQQMPLEVLKGSYYTFLDSVPTVAVVGLLVYVGCLLLTWRMEFIPISRRNTRSIIAQNYIKD